MLHVIDNLVEVLEKDESAVLGTIVKSSGSAPRTSGARMLVTQADRLYGSVGGGAVEGACQAKAGELLASSTCQFAELNFSLTAQSAAEEGMVCGGEVSVLLHKVSAENLPYFRKIQHEYRKGMRPVVLTELPREDKPPRFIETDTDIDDDLQVKLNTLVSGKKRGKPARIEHNGAQYFAEGLVHPGTVHLVGAGHVALATARLAAYVGFEVVVMDDRVEFANKERYPLAAEVRVLQSFDDCITDLGPADYVVIVTRGHLHDRNVLAQALRTGAGYIGMIGSSKKRKAVYTSLVEEGFGQADIERVYSPIGLAIGADTPEEIGVSIVGELIKVRAGTVK